MLPIAAITLLVVLGAGGWALVQEAPSPSVRLPSGAVLHLKHVDYGRRHVLREQRLWQKLLGPVLPESLQGRELIRGSSSQERLMLWFQGENDSEPWYANQRLEAVDEHGCSFDGEYMMGMPPQLRLLYRRGGLILFPRRSASFRLRLAERGATGAPATLTMANPVPGPYPTWQPEPLPNDRRVGRLQVRLLSLVAGMTRGTLLREPWDKVQDDGDASVPAGWRTRSWARAAFRITEDGQPTDRWRIARLTVSDATGNSAAYPDFETTSFTLQVGPPRGRIGLGATAASGGCIRGVMGERGGRWIAFPGLCVRESAWKLRALLSYVGPPMGQAPDLQWDVPGAPVPRAHEQTDTVAIQSWPGVRLKLIAVSGRGAWGAEKLDDPAGGVRVFVTAMPGDGVTLAVTGADERGRPAACRRFGSVDLGPYHRWWFDIHVPPGARRLSLQFRGWRGREVQFLARPMPATASQAAS